MELPIFAFSKNNNTVENPSFGLVKDGKMYREAFLDFPLLELKNVKPSDQENLNYYLERYQRLAQQVENLTQKTEQDENKGSHLMKVKHLLEEVLPTYEGLGDFEALYQRLTQLEQNIESYISANRHKNLQIKTALLAELKEVVQGLEWSTTTKQVKEIQQKWIKTGAVVAEQRANIEAEFQELVDDFFSRQSAFYADLNKMWAEKEVAFQQFVKNAEKLKKIRDEGALKQAVSQAMDEWKALGKIKAEKHTAYWDEFQKVIQSAFALAKKQDKKKKGTSEKENLALKESLIEQLKTANENEVPEVNLGEMRKKWKGIGPVPKSERKALSNVFFEQVGLVQEKIFLEDLCEKKAKKGMDEQARKGLKVKLLYGLRDRDISELNTFKENVEKFNTNNAMDGLLKKKLEQQERKVRVKDMLLAALKGKK